MGKKQKVSKVAFLKKVKGPNKDGMKTCNACGLLYKDAHRCDK